MIEQMGSSTKCNTPWATNSFCRYRIEFHTVLSTYSFFSTSIIPACDKNEFRIDLQAILNQHMGRVWIQHRYRYEFRNINSDGGRRIRYRFQITVPFNRESLEKGAIFLNANIEPFITTQPEWVFDQNRIYGGIGYAFSPSLNFQVGYMARQRTGSNDARLWFFLTHRMNFEKDKG